MHGCLAREHTGRSHWAAFSLVLFLTLVSLSTAQTSQLDEPVEDLRAILRSSSSDAKMRAQQLAPKVDHLQALADLRQAACLREWRDEDPDPLIAAVDQDYRRQVIRKLEQEASLILRRGDTASRLAVLGILNDLGASTRGAEGRQGLAHVFGPDLAVLTIRGDLTERAAAARTLGLINPDRDVALQAFSKLASAPEADLRQAAVEGMASWMRVMTHLATRAKGIDGVDASISELVQLGCALLPLAGRTMADNEVGVRRASVDVATQAAIALRKIVEEQSRLARMDASFLDEGPGRNLREELMPLILALKAQATGLSKALADADTEVRLKSRLALENMTLPQLKLLQPTTVAQTSGSAASDPLLAGLQATAQALATGLSDKDVRGRRAAIDVLETMGPAAGGATTALTTALSDSDRFVRWAAARTLGKIGSPQANEAVPALGVLLNDPDLDLRLAAVVALARFGSASKGALADVLRALGSTDAELRIACMQVLVNISDSDAVDSVSRIRGCLTDGDARVRKMAAEILGKFGPRALDAAEDLRKALQDSDAAVAKAAGDALLRIRKPLNK